MAKNTENRRTSRVKTAICDAFAELMYEKELSKITVRELVDKADVGRATFYKHYYDIYDVYEHIEKTVLVDLGAIITGEGIKLEYEVYPAVFEYIQANPKVFKMIFSPHNNVPLYQKLLQTVEGLNRMIWAESFGVNMDDSRVECAIKYHSNGCLAIVADWVISDFEQPQSFIIEALSGFDKGTQTYLREWLKAT